MFQRILSAVVLFVFCVQNVYAQVPPTLFVSNVTYNAAGQITQINYGNGNVTTYTYNPLNLRLTQLKTVKSGGNVVQDLNYTYDAVGNILSITDNVNSADQTFQYDHLNRLVQATGQTYGTKTYVYDQIGNITQKDGLTYAYDNIAGGPHAVTSLSDGTTFTYDANGNMATKQKGSDLTTYFYDAENRLIEVKLNGSTIETYSYDGDGGRTKKTPAGSTPATKFVGQLYDEQGTRKTAYVMLGNQRVASITNGSVLYYHADHLGSANVISDSSGTVKELSEYEPYGQFSRHEKYGTPDEEAWYYFTNQYLDEASSLYYYNARYYNPVLGRFTTADPVTPGLHSQALNRYTYVFNNPLKYTDPSGNFPWLAFAIGAFIGGASAAIMSYQLTGSVNLGSVLMNAITGGLSAASLVMSAAQMGIQVMQGASLAIIRTSAALHLGSQIAGAAGWAQGARAMGDASRYLGYAFMAMHVGRGIKDWASEGRAGAFDLEGNATTIESGDRVFVNGVQQDAFDPYALDLANRYEANVMFNNPKSSYIADFTEAFLQKVTFTSSLDRQLAGATAGLSNINLVGYSQGNLVIGNAMLNLGFKNSRNVVADVIFIGSPLSQPRMMISGAMSGVGFGDMQFLSKRTDWINTMGPNLNPFKLIGGLYGVASGKGFYAHMDY